MSADPLDRALLLLPPGRRRALVAALAERRDAEPDAAMAAVWHEIALRVAAADDAERDLLRAALGEAP